MLLQVRLYLAVAVARKLLVSLGTLFVNFILLVYLVLNYVSEVQVIGGQCSLRVEGDVGLLPIVVHASLTPVLVHALD